MPAYTYTNIISHAYTELRDVAGEIVGAVEKGVTKILTEAPDQWWQPAEKDTKTAPEKTSPEKADKVKGA